jgi:hypothetical protein
VHYSQRDEIKAGIRCLCLLEILTMEDTAPAGRGTVPWERRLGVGRAPPRIQDSQRYSILGTFIAARTFFS